MRKTRILFFASLLGVTCIFLAGCHPGFIPDQELRDRFARNRGDFYELVRLVNLQHQDEISIQSGPQATGPPAPADEVTWKSICDLLCRLDALSVAKGSNQVTIQVQVIDADLLNGRHYYFEYRVTAPPGLVPSLYKAWPYKPQGDYHMRLEDKWYASVIEDG